MRAGKLLLALAVLCHLSVPSRAVTLTDSLSEWIIASDIERFSIVSLLHSIAGHGREEATAEFFELCLDEAAQHGRLLVTPIGEIASNCVWMLTVTFSISG